ncbi:MAG: rod-binding protein [Pseudomonadota bacterium]
MTEITPKLPAHLPSAAAQSRQEAQLRQASEGFEALFISQVLKSGRAASLSEGLGDSSAMETTRSLLDTSLADAGASRGGLGIAEAVYRQFSGAVNGGKS